MAIDHPRWSLLKRKELGQKGDISDSLPKGLCPQPRHLGALPHTGVLKLQQLTHTYQVLTQSLSSEEQHHESRWYQLPEEEDYSKHHVLFTAHFHMHLRTEVRGVCIILDISRATQLPKPDTAHSLGELGTQRNPYKGRSP